LPTIDHDGRRIAYEEVGSGARSRPTLLLLPPGASPAAAWRPVMERLSDRFHLVAVNFAGYGETEALRADAPRDLAAEADAVAAVAARLKPPIHLVGHSYGGAVALRLAVAGALPLASLTLIEPACYHLLRPAGETALADEVEAVNFGFIDTVAQGDPETAFRAYIDYYTTGPGAWDAMPEKARGRFLAIADVVARALGSAHGETVRLDDAGALALPSVVVYGAETTMSHSRVSELLAEAIPGAQLEIVAHAAHMLTLTHPDEVARLLADFVQSTAAPAR
jgi:pimeloyl-ACP methyl ester carboxylesterase